MPITAGCGTKTRCIGTKPTNCGWSPRHDDLVWLTRHHELFSSAVFKNDPRPAYPAIDESDLGLYEYVRNYQGDQFIQHDRPDHLEMRKVVHGYFTPKSLEEWRPFVQKAVKELLDAAEEKGAHGRDAGPRDAAAGAGDRRDDGRARRPTGPISANWPRSSSISAAANTTG